MRGKIHFYADNGFLEDMKKLLKEDPKLLESQADDGQTPLWYAVFSNHTEMIKYLLSIGANPNARGGDSKWTPMHIAAIKGHTDIYDLLKAKGGNESIKDATGKTPLESKKTDGCYIATACYGNYDHPDVLIFRRYRDQFLLQTPAGKLMVSAYYKLSPSLAIRLGHVKWLSAFIRKWILEPLAQEIGNKGNI
jgi:hypothetical protein